MIHTTADSDRFVALLTRQRDLYAALRGLSEQQRVTLSSDHPERLLDILRQRQDIVSSLASLNEELGPYRRNWDAAINGLPESHRATVAGLHAEINALLRVILNADQEDAALLSARKSAASAQLADLGGTRAASAAYARTGSSGAALSADIRG
jgi:hypothetical protein